jgi:hypothetical protein
MKRYSDKIKIAESDNIHSMIGAGWADIFRGSFKDGLAYFKNEKKVLVAKDLESGIDLESKGEPVVLVVKGPHDILWARPIANGKLQTGGMASGSFIYTSNGVVMKDYHHPIRLMDRFEHGLN